VEDGESDRRRGALAAIRKSARVAGSRGVAVVPSRDPDPDEEKRYPGDDGIHLVPNIESNPAATATPGEHQKREGRRISR